MNPLKTICFFLICIFSSSAFCITENNVVGEYETEYMRTVRLTLPRVHVYNSDGKLIDKEFWPKSLTSIKSSSGEAFCCVSDETSKENNAPPKDCKKLKYGENINELFNGLSNPLSKKPILYSELPKHKYLIVEYYANWCPPCIKSRAALESFLKTDEAKNYYAVIIDFSKMTQ